MKVSSPCFVGSCVFAFRKTLRCGYFSGFKRFSKNRQKVHEMAHLEATVASAVKNWYINFVSNCYEVVGNAKWCQNIEIFRPQGPRRFLAFGALGTRDPGAQGPWGPGALGHRDPGAQGPWGTGTLGRRDPGARGPWGPGALGPRGKGKQEQKGKRNSFLHRRVTAAL